jgi:branched-chain amino acid transport system permease protein
VFSRIGRWVLLGLALIAVLGLPWVDQREQVLTLAILIFTIAAMASSWNIVSGFAGQISLGHAAFFGIGSLVTRLLWLQGLPHTAAIWPQGWPFPLSFIAGGLVAAVAAFFLGYPGLRLKGIYFSIGTLALAEAIRITVGNLYPLVTALPGDELRSYNLISRYYVCLGVLLLAVGVTYYLQHSKLGLGMVATREDEDAARSIGINVFYHKLTAFVLSAGIAGLAGGSFAFFHVSYYPSFPFGAVWTFDALIVVFIGGIGTLAGPLIGALFFVLVRDVLAANLVDIHLLIFGVLFVLVVLLFPGGLLEGWHQLHMVWRRWRVRLWQKAGDEVA